MNNSTEIRDILLEILSTGLLRIRALACAGDAKRCAIEADHIHNLPQLVASCDVEALAYYVEVERASYVEQTDAEYLLIYEPLWRRLQTHTEASRQMSAHA
jgi:hypothetical protein